MSAPAAARLHDPVAHSHALGGFVAGAVVGIAAAAGVAILVGMAATAIAAEVATAGLATPLVAGIAVTVAEFAINYKVGGAIMGFAEDTGEALGAQSMGSPSGQVAQGSPDVRINNLAAGRATDQETCDAGKIAQGSHSVYFNNLPASRVGDKISCGAAILRGSPDVFIGGPPETRGAIASEVPGWARFAAAVAGILPALGGLARAIGPAIAAVRANGFARAAQVGVKALGEAMEARAGGARPPGARGGEAEAPPPPGRRSLAEGEAAADDLLAAKPPRQSVPEGVPLSEGEFNRIRSLEHGQRPTDPADYLPQDYIDSHLAQFDNGGAYLTPTHWLDKFGRGALGRDDGVFMMPKSEMDALMTRTGGDIGKIERELGIDPGEWQQYGQLSRVDVPDPRSLNLRIPNGNESGANPNWLPGGKLPGGGSEAVVDKIPGGSFVETLIGGRP